MERDIDDLCYEAALGKIFGFEPITGHALLEKTGDAREIFKLSRDSICSLLGPYSKYKDCFTAQIVDECRSELETLKKHGCKFLGICDEDYPPMLKECPDAPLFIYLRTGSSLSELFARSCYLSIVGTRDISSYGKSWCREFVKALASCTDNPPTIVSGLALGTDITAHLAALEYGIPTIAVIPCGIDEIYPLRHSSSAHRMERAPHSAILTDYPPCTAPLAINFIRRNRIIAGLAHSTILVESKIKGGGLITTGFALEYGRSVYALPGRTEDIRSAGCNHIIRMQEAEAIESIPELLRSLGLSGRKASSGKDILERARKHYLQTMPDASTTDALNLILSTIKSNRGIGLEDLSNRCGLPYSDTLTLVTILEADSFIEVDLLQRCSACR